jgi:putative Ca2+/H+ antiporter (TMEM165/GDT1 family)
MEWLTGALAAFVVIVPVELPDKTFVATLVLATRYRPWPVWLGVTAAFGIQCAVATAAGRLLTLIPKLLFRSARRADEQEAEDEKRYQERITDSRTGRRAFFASFGVLFAAEWGDLSQLLTASLVASGRPAVPVFFGAWAALALVAGAGVALGRVLLRKIRLRVIRYIGATVCAVLALITLVAAFA